MANSKTSDGPPVQHVIHHEPQPALEALLEKHGKKLVIGLLLGVVAVCVAFIMRALGEEKLVEGSQAFTDAETIADFEKVAEDREGTPAGGSALLMLAARQGTYGKYDEARIALLQFTKEYKKHPRYFQGLFDLGLVSEKLDQDDEARKYFTEVAGSDSELAALAAYRLAENSAEAGDLKAAKEAMEGIAKKYPGNAFIEHIDTRIEAIEKRIVLAENPPPAPEPEPEPVAETPASPTAVPTPGAPNITTPEAPLIAPPGEAEIPAAPEASLLPPPGESEVPAVEAETAPPETAADPAPTGEAPSVPEETPATPETETPAE